MVRRINTIVVAPTFLKSSDAVGQIERHFFTNLPSNICSHIICAENDLQMQGENYITYQYQEKKIVLKADMLFRKLGWTDFVYSPDATYYSWSGKAFQGLKEIIKKEKIDYIHTINNPVSSHLIGYKAKKEYSLPWIAQFYDPWNNNPYRKYSFGYFARKDGERERLVAEYADLILFPNQELLESWVELYGSLVERKVAVLPFITEILRSQKQVIQNEVLTISHIGTLSKERRAQVFIKALKELKKEDPQLQDKLRVFFVGSVVDEDLRLIEDNNLSDVVTNVGGVSEQECIKYYESSDVFLIIDIDCEPNLFYPSKLLKYFSYGKPILGLARNNSVVRNELTKTHNYVCGYDDVAGVVSFIRKAISDYSSICNNDKDYGRRFEVKNVISEFISIQNRLFK